jgi:hypothetical protein
MQIMSMSRPAVGARVTAVRGDAVPVSGPRTRVPGPAPIQGPLPDPRPGGLPDPLLRHRGLFPRVADPRITQDEAGDVAGGVRRTSGTRGVERTMP